MKYLSVLLLSFYSFYAHSHIGKPLEEGLKTALISDGIILENKTGHTIKLRNITCNKKPVLIKRVRKFAGKETQQSINFIVIPNNRKINVAPPNYNLKSLESCINIELDFGSQGTFSVR